MSKQLLYKHYLRALSRWPKDALRPECQFQAAMRRRIDQQFSVTQGGLTEGGKDSAAMENVNALYSLLENRYSRKYPITGSLMNPSSNPTHYTDLIAELEQAPRRTWWGQMTNKWKGFLRFS